MNKKITFTKLILQIILFSLTFALIIGIVYAQYLKYEKVKVITEEKSKKITRLAFESLYSAMEKGWTKLEIQNIIDRLNKVDIDLEINVFRGKKVQEEYGKININLKKLENDKVLKEVLEKKKDVYNLDNLQMQYYYPLLAKNECLSCHKKAKIDDVLGVINIRYSIENLHSSFSSVVNFFLLFLILFSIIIFLLLFKNFNTYILNPIKLFISKIKNISRNKNISERIEVMNDIEELDSIKIVFNKMLDSIEKQLYFDSLTKLPNRKRLLEILDGTTNSFLLIINIDKFQEINDLYGERKGDYILKEMAILIKNIIPENVSLFKLHADEYALLYDTEINYNSIDDFADYINSSIENHIFKVNGYELSINASIGISFGNYYLLNNADIALKVAKKRKAKYLIYDSSMNIEYEYEQNLKWTKKIKDAIRDDKIVPLFQPIVNIKTKKIEKYESLIRMLDNQGSYISPIHFLEHSKKNKLYSDLTLLMIHKSFDICEKLNIQISINLSINDIVNKKIRRVIVDKLKECKFSHNIVFEILECEEIDNFEEIEKFIDEVKKYNAKISIDDFGTGYSNFRYLTNLNIDFIKIDASIIKNIDKNKKAKLTTEAIINFAKKMNIKTIAEFVHSEDVYNTTKKMGIDYAQGYYFGEPKPFNLF